MGSNASVTVWVGVNNEDLKYNTDPIYQMLPKEFFEDENCRSFAWRTSQEKQLKEKYGFTLTEVYACEELCGFGVRVYYADWNITERFDIKSLQEEIDRVTPLLQELFDYCGIEEKIDVWLQTDYN